MMRMKWRGLAFGIAAATLSLGIAACDDDTSSSKDMAASADMSAGVDMATALANGQITLADVVGTVYSPSLPNGMAPRTHTLVAVASLPKMPGTPDPSSNFDLANKMGCSIYRYDATNLPGSDGDGGNVTLSGYNTLTLATNTNTGNTKQTPTPITCVRVAQANNTYQCFYAGMMNPDGGAMGTLTDDVIFPMIPHKLHTPGGDVDIPPASGGWPFGDTCTDHLTPVTDPTTGFPIIMCEQHPLSVFSEITETVGGGADWPMKSSKVGDATAPDGGAKMFPGPLTLVKVTSGSGTTDISGADPFGGRSLSMDNPIDTSKDLNITWSCDGSTTPGAGCAGTSDLVGLLIKTSTSKRDNFSMFTAQGVGQCVGGVAQAGATITVKSNQLTALLGGQSGGSFEIALVRLRPVIQALAGGNLLVFTGGQGVFGFTNQ